MKKTLKITAMILALGATTVSLGFIAPAHAESMTQARITTANLDLATAQGQRTLKLRINHAAEVLCYDANARLDAGVRKAAKACRANITRSANAAITERSLAQSGQKRTAG